MEVSNQEGEIPIPINSTYGGGHGHGHMIHHDPHNHLVVPSSNNGPPSSSLITTTPLTSEDPNCTTPTMPYNSTTPKKLVTVRYRECLKNHAASMGGNATDGCGEFMPAGEEGTLEALTCSACNCHRNFHRKEIEGEHSNHNNSSNCDCRGIGIGSGRKLLLGHHKSVFGGDLLGSYANATPGGTLIPSRPNPHPPPHHLHHPHPHHMIMSYNFGSLPSESDEQDDVIGGGGGGGLIVARPTQLMKKRFRTKFTQEQKEKMFNFAEKVGWKIQKQEESVVQQFCQEIGVKRRVLKVWMHNNKHNLAKKTPSTA
ncbi:ZF-HD homeobox protein, Cys/His-rich dimerization domain [Dillenia turbinata]|uniref:ZF-HD homeobox protein, Cys/His-rich dimerization domain n=1 Tax=Dillenia turbinata TaxID=194707 RepID=A0AAN8UHT4_9MAGN